MSHEADGGCPGPEQFQGYLQHLARLYLDPRLRGQFDPLDLVQQTLLEAHQRQEQFRGACAAQMKGWLRTTLLHNLLDAVRRITQQRRNVEREVSLDALQGSSARLQGLLAAEQSSPSERAIEKEELLRLEEALAQLPEAQREAIALHHLQGWSLAEVADHLDRSEAAVAGLLHRGLDKLRALLT